jgi:flagellar FliL protein
MPDDKLDNDATAVAENASDAAPSKKKGSSSFIIYIVIALVMSVGGYFAGTKLIGSSSPEDEMAETHDGDKKDKKGKKGEPVHSEVYMIEDVIVNPAGTGGTRFLSVSIGFEISSKETIALFEKRGPLIKDALLTILGSKTIEQLSDAKEKEITRYQIKRRIEQLLRSEDIMAVYFTDFILQ